MNSAGKPWWQQASALVSLSASGAITGFSFAPATPAAAADSPAPSGAHIRLLAFRQAAQPAPAPDAALRSAIVNVADYYLRMAKVKTPAEMEAVIWQHDSVDGVDHGASCAAFASLTLELAAQVVGQQSWVTGGTSYPWPLHKWADVRVDPNPASPGIESVLQDAQAHGRWHPLGDGYRPQPGDWVLFDGHVEVVTKYADRVLRTIGGDSMPDFSVNAHEYSGPLGAQGVAGFVNNGGLPGPSVSTARGGARAAAADSAQGTYQVEDQAAVGTAAIPGAPATGSATAAAPARPSRAAAAPAARARAVSSGRNASPSRRVEVRAPHGSRAAAAAGRKEGEADVPGTLFPRSAVSARPAAADTAAIPGLSAAATALSPSATRYSRHVPPQTSATVPDAGTQSAFIAEVAPGAVASQRRYGVPAAVTIAQAIDESGWGQSTLATQDHNLFGIKGTGPAGSDRQPTQEYENGRLVTRAAPFRVYRSVAESIDDHGRLLATSGYYTRSMSDRRDPNAFASALTGVYATDPDYGAKLIGLMQRYDLYRYDASARPAAARPATAGHVAAGHATARPAAAAPVTAAPGGAAIPGLGHHAPVAPVSAAAHAPVAAATAPTAQAAPPFQDAPSAQAATSPARAVPSPEPSGTSAAPTEQSVAARPLTRAARSAQTLTVERQPSPAEYPMRRITPRPGNTGSNRYQEQIPQSVRNAFAARARMPLTREEPLYRDVASHSGLRWELLAACDWMQCEARPRYSPVHGEKLGTQNPDGTTYRTKSEALEQCAYELVELAREVYWIDLTSRRDLSVRDLANVFAAFRWGGLLKLHRTSAMEFPYSVAGLTARHLNMRWPDIDDQNAPDKPGGRFRMAFGAVPIVLSLDYPATV